MSTNGSPQSGAIVLTLCTGLLALSYIFRFEPLSIAALAVGAAAVLSPAVQGWIAQGWMLFGKLLGWVNSRILLSVIFFLILTPIAFFFRLFGGDPMGFKRGKEGSNWLERNKTFKPGDQINPW